MEHAGRGRALARSALWFLAFLTASGGLSLALVRVRQPSTAGTNAPARAVAAPPPAAAGLPLEPIGRFPSFQAAYDPTTPGRVHASGQLSEDGGATWRPIVGEDGRSIVPLGGKRALAPAIGPDGSVVYGEVLFDEPGITRGRGQIAHGAEWRGGRWHALLPVDLSGNHGFDEPRWLVVSPAHWKGRAALATESAIVGATGASLATPVRASAVLAASDGSLYVATSEPSRFPLYEHQSASGSWLPVPGAHPVAALAEGGGAVWAAGQHIGRREPTGTWQWTSLPLTWPDGLAVHPRRPLAVVWNFDRLVICREGAPPRVVPLGEVDVAGAGFDAGHDDAITLVGHDGAARRLSLASLR